MLGVEGADADERVDFLRASHNEQLLQVKQPRRLWSRRGCSRHDGLGCKIIDAREALGSMDLASGGGDLIQIAHQLGAASYEQGSSTINRQQDWQRRRRSNDKHQTVGQPGLGQDGTWLGEDAALRRARAQPARSWRPPCSTCTHSH